MGEWKPIETAPTGLQVQCGKWEKEGYGVDSLEWKTSVGTAWESRFFGLGRKRAYFGREYSHWKPLPEPPNDGD